MGTPSQGGPLDVAVVSFSAMKNPPRLECFLVALGIGVLPSVMAAPAQGPAFHASFDRYVQEDGVVGAAYVVLDKGKVTEAHQAGLADLERRQAVDSNTIFHWASITKTLTAVAIMQLRDHGKLSLDDPIIKYVPELTRVHSEDNSISLVTLRHLLSHSAGFQSPTWPYRDDSKPWQPFEPTEWEQLVAMMPYQELAFAPGTKFQYSNPGFIYLARVIEAVTGDPYQVYVQKNILTPLAMTRSYYNLTPYHLSQNRSNSYTIRLSNDGHRETVANGREFHTGITTPNGGLNAPLDDLARWVAFLAGPSPGSTSDLILARKSLEEMWQPVVPVNPGTATEPPVNMGLSFFLYPRGSGGNAVTFVGHTGHQAAFRTFIVFNPHNGHALIAAFNTSDDEGSTPAALQAFRNSNRGFDSLIERALEALQ
jgi:CubicO group peptidase (beta-lactamase class C family)